MATAVLRARPALLGRSNLPTVLALVAMAIYLTLHRVLLPEEIGRPALKDWGWVSWYTMGMIALAWVLIAVETARAPSPRARWALLAILYIGFIYFAREADFHRLFTAENVTRRKFYTDGDIPAAQRLVAGTIMLAFAVLMLRAMVRYARPVWRAFRARIPWAVALCLWGGTLFLSQLADKLMRGGYTGRVVEEGLEATASTLAVLAVLHARSDRDRLPEP